MRPSITVMFGELRQSRISVATASSVRFLHQGSLFDTYEMLLAHRIEKECDVKRNAQRDAERAQMEAEMYAAMAIALTVASHDKRVGDAILLPSPLETQTLGMPNPEFVCMSSKQEFTSASKREIRKEVSFVL